MIAVACGRVSEIGAGEGSGGGSGAGAGSAGVGNTAGLGGSSGSQGGSSGSQGGSAQAGSTGSGANGGYGGYGGSYGYGGNPGYGGSSTSGGTGGVWDPYPGDDLGEGYVVSKLRLGDRDEAGNPSSSAWKSLGVNLDGWDSNQDSTRHCLPQPGAQPASVKTDGEGGIDNSFGANVLPLLLSLDGAISDLQQPYIDSGRSIVALTGPLSQDVPSIAGSMSGAKYYYPDTFDVVAPWLVNDARCALTGSVSGGTLDLTGTGYWELRLQLPSSELVMRVRHARVVASVNSDASLSDAKLAGLLDTEEFVEAVRQALGGVSPMLCDGEPFETLAAQIRAASDIRTNATNGDPELICNAISIGLGASLLPVNAWKSHSDPKPVQTCF